MKQQVVVIGLGRFGSAVATELSRLGHDVLGVDSRLTTVQALSGELSHVVQADATDEESLARLNLAEFDAAVVGITDNLETSILTTLLLKHLGLKRVVAKARDKMHGEILALVGADRVVYPERETGLRVAHTWTSADVTDSLDVIPGYTISRASVPEALVGQTIARAITERGINVSLLLLARGERVTVYPSASETLRAGDTLMIAGALPDIERFFTSLSPPA
ncbi:MAG: TrkA family potassium uptake protein [Dehalococcoidia bacterium]|nr:TrkA family potassium uptake protein [Dehalococcoidia bacterium]